MLGVIQLAMKKYIIAATFLLVACLLVMMQTHATDSWANNVGLVGCGSGTYVKADGTGCGTPSGTGIANVQITTGTTLIAANTCTSATNTTMTGVATTSAIVPPTPTTDTSAVTGWGSTGGLYFTYWVTSNTFSWRVCNGTASPITPGGSVSWNVGAR